MTAAVIADAADANPHPDTAMALTTRIKDSMGGVIASMPMLKINTPQ
jgi:hypothetical protein